MKLQVQIKKMEKNVEGINFFVKNQVVKLLSLFSIIVVLFVIVENHQKV